MLSGKVALLSACSLGGICFAPFFAFSDWVGQSSKGSKWSIKNGSEKVASIYFDSSSTEHTNQNLKGTWVLPNQKKSNEANVFSSAGFEVALSTEKFPSSYEKPDILNEKATIFYCKREKGEGMVLAKTSSTGKTIYCKDLSESWYLGTIKGKHYRALFAVEKEGILKKSAGRSISSFSKLTKNDEEKLHETLVKVLKLAARPRGQKTFDTDAILLNTKTLDYGTQEYAQSWCSRDICFLWGKVYSVGEENNTADNCTKKDSLEGCEFEMIDISGNNTLKSFSPFWEFSSHIVEKENL